MKDVMKEKKMKILWSLAIAISLLLWGGGIGYAAISGVCSNCHTMHNSQDGSAEVETYSGGVLTTGGTPQNQLLKASCIACHTGALGDTDHLNTHDAPIVLHISAPSGQGGGKTLAGGDFYWVADSLGNDDTMGHNVDGIAVGDAMGYTPPGFDAGATPGALDDGTMGSSWSVDNQLTCAGTYGCHGTHDNTNADAAIAGAHHGNTGGTANQANTSDTVGNSYRFLGGIKGLENITWNWAESTSDHNEYYGAAAPSAYVDKSTISYSCAQCHGNFHQTAEIGGTSSPWTRHPTDFVLPTTGEEYSAYNPDNGNAYSVEAPVARGVVPASSGSTVQVDGTADADGAIVMCLSCHRAHGSPEPDLLRWTYSGIQAGTGTDDDGCFVCHTTKNADSID